jgi:hypothetical protein
MKTTAIVAAVLVGLMLCLSALVARGGADQPSAQAGATSNALLTAKPKDSDAVTAAEGQYIKVLLASANDPKLSKEDQLTYWVRLAELGYMPAFDTIAKYAKDPTPEALYWMACIGAVYQADRPAILKMLGSDKEEVRWTGILLAGHLGMKEELRDFAEKAAKLDATTQRGLWLGRALARDFSIVSVLASAAEDKGVDGHFARMAFAAFFGEDSEMTLAEFRKRLEAVLADARPPTEPMPSKAAKQ